MATDPKHDFNSSGPKHFVGTPIDWGNAHHRTISMACLVRGVSASKSDQKANRHGSNAFAPPWWENFHFEKIKDLHDPQSNNSIFGAIFKFNPPYPISQSGIRPPTYVIAFRGTSLKKDSYKGDLKLDFDCIVNRLHKGSPIQIAMEAVTEVLGQNPSTAHIDSIWLAGHSLGAAIALTIGRELVLKFNIHLQAYLFNPPCVHLPAAGSSKVDGFKRFVRGFRSFVIAAAITMKGCHEDDSEFHKLSSWVPNIFVNPKDYFCREYIDYFEHRERMDNIGLGRLERLATQHSVASLISGAKPSHLLPVAYLTINKGTKRRQAHGLKQWWVSDQEFHWESKKCDKYWEGNSVQHGSNGASSSGGNV